MITCKNCGAEFDAKALKCPFCGHENVAAAQDAYHDKIDKIIEEREEVHKLPDKIVKKSTKTIVKVVALIPIVVIVVALALFFGNKAKLKNQYKIEQENKVKMEEFLEAGDYVGLGEFYTNVEYSYSAYEKYEEVHWVYGYYEDVVRDIDDLDFYFPDGKQDLLVDVVADGMQDLWRLYDVANKCLTDNRRLGNESHIEAIWEMGKTDFMREYEVDEDMIVAILEIADDSFDTPAYDELAKEVVPKLIEKYK